jgi:transketolase
VENSVDMHLSKMANVIRALSMDSVEKANSGHPGMPMGMADVATVLFSKHLKFDPTHPNWPDRDRFVLSAGHGSMLIYSLLYLTGYPDMSLDDIKNFRQFGAKTAGHPEFGHASGIETTTGPLGQGLANAVGMALAERLMQARFGDDLVNHRTYTIVGDGCLMEGISQEAITLAGHLKLNKLIVLWDDNKICIDGPTSLTISEDTCKRFEAAGWSVLAVDGHDFVAVSEAIDKAKSSDKPSFIACRTTIGFGAPTKAGKSSSHGSPLGKDEIIGARKNIGWEYGEFEVPDDILKEWRGVGKKGGSDFDAWTERLNIAELSKKAEFERLAEKNLPENWVAEFEKFKKSLAETKPNEATRKSSENVLQILTAAIPELIGGSADLTGSNNTKTKVTAPVQADDFAGRYIYYGVREHAMAAIMNGMALHGEFIPYGGTFLVFTDYCRGAIRLSALMEQRVIYVMTHDSIGLGEDGPTHQPVEHLASLRAIPNLYVFRPADATETAECWAMALSLNAPSILSLSRQNLPAVRTEYTAENLCAKGGYVLSASTIHHPPITIIATGSEIEIALAAQKQLAEKGVAAKVVSMPCWELFDQQPKSYREEVLGKDTIKVAIEAALGFGWERYIGIDGIFIGMNGFGASAPATELYKHFGITADAVVTAVLGKVE